MASATSSQGISPHNQTLVPSVPSVANTSSTKRSLDDSIETPIRKRIGEGLELSTDPAATSPDCEGSDGQIKRTVVFQQAREEAFIEGYKLGHKDALQRVLDVCGEPDHDKAHQEGKRFAIALLNAIAETCDRSTKKDLLRLWLEMNNSSSREDAIVDANAWVGSMLVAVVFR